MSCCRLLPRSFAAAAAPCNAVCYAMHSKGTDTPCACPRQMRFSPIYASIGLHVACDRIMGTQVHGNADAKPNPVQRRLLLVGDELRAPSRPLAVFRTADCDNNHWSLSRLQECLPLAPKRCCGQGQANGHAPERQSVSEHWPAASIRYGEAGRICLPLKVPRTPREAVLFLCRASGGSNPLGGLNDWVGWVGCTGLGLLKSNINTGLRAERSSSIPWIAVSVREQHCQGRQRSTQPLSCSLFFSTQAPGVNMRLYYHLAL